MCSSGRHSFVHVCTLPTAGPSSFLQSLDPSQPAIPRPFSPTWLRHLKLQQDGIQQTFQGLYGSWLRASQQLCTGQSAAQVLAAQMGWRSYPAVSRFHNGIPVGLWVVVHRNRTFICCKTSPRLQERHHFRCSSSFPNDPGQACHMPGSRH